ncbi:hypothetical protein [Dactylosporangium sp. NPDC051541]|uniref:hypothetical protein n=1 Tax=Dactylosporangium sp. NPDC051541 TaxID=3363977 RepID=UPI0037969959
MLQRVGGVFGASVLSLVAVAALGGPGFAAPIPREAPSPSAGSSAPANPNLGPAISGTTMCTMNDPQLTEISGLVVTADGYAVINDSNIERSREKIFFLNGECGVTRSVQYPSSAFDPEDLAVGKDGTLWVADVGDNTTLTGGSGNRRSSIALWSLAPGANTPVIHRLAYPDGKARDAEALIIDADGRPVLITKDPVGEVYTTAQPLPANNANPAPLTRAGTFRPQATGTANPYGIVGTAVVTGAALSPDGKRAVVRTMSDAYEFDVTDGDVAAAITGGSKPRITPLPSEPQGESIAYSRDGTEFLTTSDQPKATPIQKYTPFAPPAPASAAPVVQAQAPKAADRSFLDSLSLRDLTRIVMGIGVFGLLMIAVGVFAVVRSRRRRRALLAASSASTSTSASGAADTGTGTGSGAGPGTSREPALASGTDVDVDVDVDGEPGLGSDGTTRLGSGAAPASAAAAGRGGEPDLIADAARESGLGAAAESKPGSGLGADAPPAIPQSSNAGETTGASAAATRSATASAAATGRMSAPAAVSDANSPAPASSTDTDTDTDTDADTDADADASVPAAAAVTDAGCSAPAAAVPAAAVPAQGAGNGKGTDASGPAGDSATKERSAAPTAGAAQEANATNATNVSRPAKATKAARSSRAPKRPRSTGTSEDSGSS